MFTKGQEYEWKYVAAGMGSGGNLEEIPETWHGEASKVLCG